MLIQDLRFFQVRDLSFFLTLNWLSVQPKQAQSNCQQTPSSKGYDIDFDVIFVIRCQMNLVSPCEFWYCLYNQLIEGLRKHLNHTKNEEIS